jgi:hypothetical protein
MRMNRIALAVALTTVLANAAFAKNVKTASDKSTNFSAYKTFMWIKEPRVVDPLMRERVVTDINAALVASGLQFVTAGADLGIAAHGATRVEHTLAAFYDGFDGGWRWDGVVRSEATATAVYETGTLVVDIFDANTKDLIWRGTASKTLAGNPQKTGDNLSKAMAKMFRNFPPMPEEKGGVLGWLVEFLARGLVASGR